MALIELTVRALIRFLPDNLYSTFSMFGISGNMQLRFLVILTRSVEARLVVKQVTVLEINQNAILQAVAALITWKTLATVD